MIWLYTATVFLSAALLFMVQPLAGKMVLPLAGGSSAVWTTCMLFFQAGLLAGYMYSHLLTTRVRLVGQVAVHALLAAGAVVALPMFIPADAGGPTSGSVTGWLLTSLGTAFGLPFFVVSTTGPLVQRWFSRTRHPSAKDPYFLYAASNVGSAVGLLGYPFLIEPRLSLIEQSLWWAGGYILLGLMLVACGVVAWRAAGEAEALGERSAAEEAPPEPVSWRRRMHWTLLAAVPSSLMIGVTQIIATDLASVPLLWVVPLFLYLMTFSVAFSPRIPMPAWVLGWLLGAFSLLAAYVVMTGRHSPFVLIALTHLICFTLAALMCHRRLADDRPSPARLTEFFFFLALGGVLGGAFNALVAPAAFTLISEYPIALALAVCLRPAPRVSIGRFAWLNPAGAGQRWLALVAGVLATIAVYFGTGAAGRAAGLGVGSVENLQTIATLGVCFATIMVLAWPGVTAAALAAAMLTGQYVSKHAYGDETLTIRRSFFGVNHVYRIDPRAEGKAPAMFKLLHGTTLHGAQLRGSTTRARADGTTFEHDARLDPTTYYHRLGPVGDIMRAAASGGPARSAQERAAFSLVSLARGSLLADGLAPGPGSALVALAAIPGAMNAIAENVRPSSPATSVAVIGLGTGSVAAYAQRGDSYRFYEIDPVVRDLASDPQYFTYLDDARQRGASIQIVLGDGRREIAKAADGSYGVIMLDAFSSDSIPVHLLTVEAMDTYLKKLRPDGLLAVHISNRYFDLSPVLARVCEQLGVPVFVSTDAQGTNEPGSRGYTPERGKYEEMSRSVWVVIARDERALAPFAGDSKFWVRMPKAPGGDRYLWQDDFSNVLDVLKGFKN